MHPSKRFAHLAVLAVAGAVAVSLAACGDDDADTAATLPAATSSVSDTTAHANHQTVVVDGVDYGFENLPVEVPAGTPLAFRNTSDTEFHEMVVMRIPDGETRSVGQLAALPPAESDAIFAGAMPALVSVAAPGEEGTAVLGDGTITEPGRYAVVCFIPVGADPAVVAEAMHSESSTPPDLGDGAPHISQGMYAELIVSEST